MNEQTTLQCIIMLKAAYPKQPLSDETIDLYEMALADIPAELLRAAILQVISQHPWATFPSIAEIRQTAVSLAIQADGQPDASTAWGEVMRQMRNRGRWRAPELDEMSRKAVDAIGGWMYLCNSDNPAADRARFMEAYGALQRRQANDLVMLPAVRDYVDQLAAERQLLAGEAIASLAVRFRQPEQLSGPEEEA